MVKIYVGHEDDKVKFLKYWLEVKGVPYTQVNVLQEPGAMTTVVQATNSYGLPAIQNGETWMKRYDSTRLAEFILEEN